MASLLSALKRGSGTGKKRGSACTQESSDPSFEEAKRGWTELDAFFTTVYKAYLAATSGLIALARPLNQLESTVRDYFDDRGQEGPRVVRRFSSSVVKLNVATTRFEEMLEEARIQICLEEWLLKLDVVKQDIENRERLYSEFTREKKNWSNLLQKTEQKKLIEDPATIAKLNKVIYLSSPLSLFKAAQDRPA